MKQDKRIVVIVKQTDTKCVQTIDQVVREE